MARKTYVFDGYGLHVEPRSPKHLFDTGWGDKSYTDEDGLTRHVPPRTKYTHPYSYDPIVMIDSGKEPNGSAYSDRMQQWDYAKFDRCLDTHNRGLGEMRFSWGNKALVQKFCRDYFDDPTLEIVRVVEMCNASNGFPLWFIAWHSSKKA